MADYKLDGKYLYARGRKVGEFDGRYFRDDRGSKVGELDGKYIRDARGSKIAEIDVDNIRDARGSKIGTLSDIRKIIDGTGGATLAGFWVLLIR